MCHLIPCDSNLSDVDRKNHLYKSPRSNHLARIYQLARDPSRPIAQYTKSDKKHSQKKVSQANSRELMTTTKIE
jgi:hypothetical protein